MESCMARDGRDDGAVYCGATVQPLMCIYLKSNRAKFHADRIWNDVALGFQKVSGHLNEIEEEEEEEEAQ